MRSLVFLAIMWMALASLAPAQRIQAVPASVDDAAASETLRRILGLPAGQPITPITQTTYPLVLHDVTFLSQDGMVLGATYGHSPTDPQALTVIVIHDIEQDRRAMADLARFLMLEGCSVLTIDLRGYGDSTRRTDGSEIHARDFERVAQTDVFDQMPMDVAAGIAWLRERDLVRQGGIVLLGRRLGALVAGVSVVRQGRFVRGAILEAPPLSFRGVNLRETIAQIQGRPLLILAPAQDRMAMGSVRTLADANRTVIPAAIQNTNAGTILVDHPEGREEIRTYLELLRRN